MAVKVCRRTNKISYRSVGEARAAWREIVRSQTQRIFYKKQETGAYRCLYCPYWHLTSEHQTTNGVNFQ